MNELKIMGLDSTDITSWDFQALMAELQAITFEDADLIYSDDTIKYAKKDRAILNKAKKVVEEARKAYKARCLEPYDALKPQVKELTDLIEEKRKQIDDIVKEYEDRQKEAKGKEIMEYYDRISGSLGEDAEKLYQKIFDPKWTNDSFKTKYREAMQIAVASAAKDLESIMALDSPFVDTLREKYIETLSMEAVLEKDEELKEAVGKAGLTGATDGETLSAQAVSAQTAAIPSNRTADEEEGTLVRIHASQKRLDMICDFMRAIGVSFEIV